MIRDFTESTIDEVALAFLIAESDPAQKDSMVRLFLNLLDDGG